MVAFFHLFLKAENHAVTFDEIHPSSKMEANSQGSFMVTIKDKKNYLLSGHKFLGLVVTIQFFLYGYLPGLPVS